MSENYSEERLTKLEESPSRTTIREGESHYYANRDFPYVRARQWMKSHIGYSINKVFAEWVTLPWIPARLCNSEGFYTVVDKAVLLNGVIFDFRGWNPIHKWYNQRVYDDPKTHILKLSKKVPWPRRDKEAIAKWFRPLSLTLQLIKENGIWYMFEVPTEYSTFDWANQRVALKTLRRRIDQPWMKCPNCMPTSKHQLNSKELKRYNLENDR